MNIVLPIVFFAVVVGLFTPRHHIRRMYGVVILWIALVVAYYWMKN